MRNADDHYSPPIATALVHQICAISGCAPATVRAYYNDPRKVRPASRVRIERALVQIDPVAYGLPGMPGHRTGVDDILDRVSVTDPFASAYNWHGRPGTR